jgi:uncharacterized protein YecT (DUF1311 family)
MNWRYNSSRSRRLFARRAALLVLLLVPIIQIRAQTQAAMNAQARADFVRADADLNKTYQAVLAKLRDAVSKQKLREKQRAWLASRDAEAARAAGQAEGGSMAPIIRYETMTHLTRQRIKELKIMLVNGTASPAKPAASSVTRSPTSTPESEREGAAGEDSSTGLPDAYAKDNLIARSTISPDKKFAVMYPASEPEGSSDLGDYIISLKPFAVLGRLNTKGPYFKNQNHGDLSAVWSDDSSVVLVTLGIKWGPGDIFLVELKDGKVTRTTNLLAKIHDLLLPDYRKAKAAQYNDYYDFIFESENNPVCQLDDSRQVRINALATTDPKGGGNERVWDGRLKATWDIAQAKFISQKVTREFAGVRKHED